jgi:hypothetical protein
MSHQPKKEEVKENFCVSCVAGLTAIAGAGTASSSGKVSDRKTRKIIFWLGLIISILSVIFLIWRLCFSNCSNCR